MKKKKGTKFKLNGYRVEIYHDGNQYFTIIEAPDYRVIFNNEGCDGDDHLNTARKNAKARIGQ